MWGTHEGCAQTLPDCSSLFTHHGAVCIWLCGADAALWWVGDPARWRIRRAKCEIKQQMKACSLQRQNPVAVRAGKYVWFSDPGCNHTHYWVPFQSMFQLWASCLFKSKRKRSHFDHFRSFGWMSRVFWCFWRLKSQLMSDLRRWRWRERFFPHHQTTYVNDIWKLYPVICSQRAFSFPFFWQLVIIEQNRFERHLHLRVAALGRLGWRGCFPPCQPGNGTQICWNTFRMNEKNQKSRQGTQDHCSCLGSECATLMDMQECDNVSGPLLFSSFTQQAPQHISLVPIQCLGHLDSASLT